MKGARRPVIIDADPGLGFPWADVDDNLAVALALAHEELDVRLISVVAGNTPAPEGAASISETVAKLDRSVPVALGAQKPLVKPFVSGRELLAERLKGQAGENRPESARNPPALPEHLPSALSAQIELLESSRERPDMVCLGPLTNLATLARERPDLLLRLGSVVIMGGAIDHPGNVTPAAEFNIWIDPEAAGIVFAAPVPKILVALDVTTSVEIAQAEVENALCGGSPAAQYLVEGVRSWTGIWRSARGAASFVPHDPVALSYLIDPTLFESEPMRVVVDRDTGRTCGEREPSSDLQVARRIDAARFKRLFLAALSRIAGAGSADEARD